MRYGGRLTIILLVLTAALLTGCVHIPDNGVQSDEDVNYYAEEMADNGIADKNIDYKISSHEVRIGENDNNIELCSYSFCYYNHCIYYASRAYTGDSEYTYYVNRYNPVDDKCSVILEFGCLYPDGIGIGNINQIRIVNDKISVFIYSVNTDNSEYGEGNIHFQKRVYDLEGNEVAIVELENDKRVDSDCVCYIDRADNTYIYCKDDRENNKGLLLQYDDNGRIVTSKQAGYDLKGAAANMYVIEDNGDELLLNGSYNSIFSYNIQTEELLRIIDGNKYSIDTLNMLYFTKVDEDSYICIVDGEHASNESGIEVVELVKNDNADDSRQVIRIVSKGLTDVNLKNVIDAYNRQNASIRIDYIVYDDTGSSLEYEKDIARGLLPDIYVVDGFDTDDLISKGLIEELSSYMKKDDILTDDYFVDGYLDALKVDEKLYYLSRGFYLDSLCCDGSEAKLINQPFNIESLIKYYDSKPDNTLISDKLIGDYLFKVLYKCNEQRFVNYETGECDFDNKDFRNILKLCSETEKKYENVYNENFDNNEYALFADREIRGLYDIQDNNILFEGDAFYIGYPSDNNEGLTILKTYGSTFAMSSVSEHKEEAWRVIKELMTGQYNKYDHEFLSSSYIPSTKVEYELYVNDCMCSSDYVAKDGKQVRYAVKESVRGTDMKPCSDEELSVLSGLMSNARYCSDTSNYYDEIMEDVNQYTKGKKDIATTIDIISDRMTKYINENR